MRFAFLILGPRFEPERDRAAILDGTAQIVGVPTVEQAARQAERLCREGVDCIELCGAFGEAGARAVIAAALLQSDGADFAGGGRGVCRAW